MPGSGAEKYVTSAYVTAVKRANRDARDDVRLTGQCCEPELTGPAGPGAGAPRRGYGQGL